MKLLLTSFGHPHIREFVSGPEKGREKGPGNGTDTAHQKTIAYISDATRTYGDQPWLETERRMLRDAGFTLVELRLDSTEPSEIDAILSSVTAVYVAGGETFDLLLVLRTTGADEILSRHVRAGLPYIGTSAGAIVAGPSIQPASLLDSPDIAPDLTDYTGLGFTDRVVIPHAAGNLPPFPIDLIAETVRVYGQQYPLTLLRDGEALLIDDTGTRLI